MILLYTSGLIKDICFILCNCKHFKKTFPFLLKMACLFYSAGSCLETLRLREKKDLLGHTNL